MDFDAGVFVALFFDPGLWLVCLLFAFLARKTHLLIRIISAVYAGLVAKAILVSVLSTKLDPLSFLVVIPVGILSAGALQAYRKNPEKNPADSHNKLRSVIGSGWYRLLLLVRFGASLVVGLALLYGLVKHGVRHPAEVVIGALMPVIAFYAPLIAAYALMYVYLWVKAGFDEDKKT